MSKNSHLENFKKKIDATTTPKNTVQCLSVLPGLQWVFENDTILSLAEYGIEHIRKILQNPTLIMPVRASFTISLGKEGWSETRTQILTLLIQDKKLTILNWERLDSDEDEKAELQLAIDTMQNSRFLSFIRS